VPPDGTRVINNNQVFCTSLEKVKMSSRKCKYDADAFCYICGQFVKVRDVKFVLKTCNVLCKAYEAYFNFPVWNQDKPWAPHVACGVCKRSLEGEQFSSGGKI